MERGGLHILSGIVSSVCREYGLQQITSLTSTQKAGEMMSVDIISNSWRGILLLSPSRISRICLFGTSVESTVLILFLLISPK